MEFKVGDRVRIREDLQEDEGWDGTWVTNAMLDYRGKMATIKWARDNYYRIDLDDEEFAWVGPFFENPLKLKLEELEKRIEKLEKCVMGEQNTIEKCENVSNLEKKTPKLGIKDFKDMIRPNKIISNTNDPLEMIWNTNDEEEAIPSLLTEDERVILRNIDREIYKWIARDSNDALNIFERKPIKEDLLYMIDYWDDNGGCREYLTAFEHLFQFIKWEDDEPYNIEELLKGESGNEN